MDELDAKVAEAMVASCYGDDEWHAIDDDAREEWIGHARAAIAAMREHSGGGYEAAARECERRAEECRDKADESTPASHAASYWCGQKFGLREAARIIREHAQPARPVVDREGLANMLSDCPHLDFEEWGVYRDDILKVADAILAHLGAQPAVPAACSNCNGTDITPPRCETCGARGDELAQPAAEPASEPFRESVRIGDEPSDVDAPGAIAALRARTASAPAPAASEPVATDGMRSEALRMAVRMAQRDVFVPSALAAPDVSAGERLAQTLEGHAGESGQAVERMAYLHAAGIVRAALAAAPQRVREVGEDDAERVLAVWPMGTAISVRAVVQALRAAGLVVAVPDGEWAALVAERDGLREQLAEGRDYAAAREAHDRRQAENNALRDQLAAATKRAEEYASAIGQIESVLGYAGARPVEATVADVREMANAFARATKRAEDAERERDYNCALGGDIGEMEAAELGDDILAAWHAGNEQRKKTEEHVRGVMRARDAAEARVRELEAAQRSDDRDNQRVVEERGPLVWDGSAWIAPAARPVVATVLGGGSVPVTELNAIAEREIAAADGARCSYARQGERVVKALMERMHSAARPVVDAGARKALDHVIHAVRALNAAGSSASGFDGTKLLLDDARAALNGEG